MSRKFIAILLSLGILLSIDCKELMRLGKNCPMQNLSETKKISPCHKQKESAEKKDCNCKVNDKAIAEKSELKIQSPKIFYAVVLFENVFITNTKENLKFYSYSILNQPPIPLYLPTTTTHLLI